MTARRSATAFGVLVAALLVTACEGVIDPSKNQIDMVPGTLAVNGQVLHEFTAAKSGEFEIKITQLAPNADAFIGVSYGPVQNGTCVRTYQTNYYAQLNKPALGGHITSGRYCLLVFDVGTLSQPAAYTLRVSHP
jgi:hypothetical protein